MKRRRVRHLHREMTDDELGRMVMQNLGNSMGASFYDTSGIEQLAREEAALFVSEGFEESPEYAAALEAYKLRIGKL
ncbi:MAG TPA: hypothetical protein O0X39_08305 [Methanocorpusculum sp.]|nr:hypothetical protein [Methanocorpusculum sp.]